LYTFIKKVRGKSATQEQSEQVSVPFSSHLGLWRRRLVARNQCSFLMNRLRRPDNAIIENRRFFSRNSDLVV